MPEPDEKSQTCAFLDDQGEQHVEEFSGDRNTEAASGVSTAKHEAAQPIDNDRSQITIVSDAKSPKPNSSSPGADSKRWLPRILDFKALWHDSKTAQRQTLPIHPAEEPKSVKSINTLNAGEDHDSTSEAAAKESCCSGCAINGCPSEVPYTRVLHSKETFSKFLQDVSLSDMRVVAQMSFLCDLAYMIPDIQPGELLKYHHLRFVTSSLDKRAAAAAVEKESDSSKKLSPTPLENHATHCDESDTSEDGAAARCFQKDLEQIESGPEERRQDHVESLMAVAPVTAVVVAEEETKQAVANDLKSSHFCPCEWYICDDDSSHTRIFVIQGSESLASWQANLLFEPTKFEGLDVLVHRGIYEAANGLYEQVLPEILSHFRAHGDLAQVRFTGHSLGGSLAALLALMFQIQGVLPHSAILPVITFGSPCIMCGGDNLLQRLNSPPSHIQSVIMHRDVVPRAFACDYPDHVAQVLKRLNGRFRNHPCLNNQKLLYAPMGQILILQPDEELAPSHPLLPNGNGMYLLRHPVHGADLEKATQLRAAQRAFLNMPHPLEILSDPGAYGFEGAISRDHDPRSYTKAVHMALRHALKRVRRLQREQRKKLWWPLVIAESSLLAQKGSKAGMSTEQTRTSGAITPAGSKFSLVFKQSVHYARTNPVEFPMGNSSVWGSHKVAFSRYARLIASQHVQMGMLFILSVRMVILESLSALFVWI